MIQDLIAEPTDRLRSYELIAASFGLQTGGQFGPAVRDIDEATVS